jgi:flavin-dependent dehydrogenase
MEVDVAIIGGGPAGSTAGTYLKMFDPNLKVAIFEREIFPRDHVGESQLPILSRYLDEMGVWDKVEAANFPIKVGGTFKWGCTKELWDFDFINPSALDDSQRPGKYDSVRKFTAFQVDRAVYDEILLDHAEEKGCLVRQGTKVAKINTDGDNVTSIQLSDGEEVTARYYLDATGHVGLLRRAFDIPSEYPTGLQNVAFWDYWEDAEWADTIGTGATRIQIMSVDFGWIWFIPIGATRTSVGLVCPAEYYKNSGKRPEELYAQALQEDARIAHLMRNATCQNKFSTTKDWSFVAQRIYGENWFLVGESAGFADPILSAGLSITQGAAREVAFTILEMDRKSHDPAWLKEEYQKLQFNRIRNHIRFADYWYSANSQFKDLQEFTAKIAAMNGLEMEPDKAWRWLAQGGFIDDDLTAGTATLGISSIKSLGKYLSPLDTGSPLETNNVFKLNLAGATFNKRAIYENGRVKKYDAYQRDGKLLPLEGVFEVIVTMLERDGTLPGITGQLGNLARQYQGDDYFKTWVLDRFTVALEAMIHNGFVEASYDPALPLSSLAQDLSTFRWHEEKNPELIKLKEKGQL